MFLFEDRTELGTMVSGVNCAACKYGTLLPRHPLDYNSVWECSDCDNLVQNETIANKLNKYEEDIENMEKNKVRPNWRTRWRHFATTYLPKQIGSFRV